MKVKIKNNKKLELLKRSTFQSAGYDVPLNEDIVLQPWERVKLNIPIEIEIPQGKKALLVLRSSSGTKHYLRLIDGHKKYIKYKEYKSGIYKSLDFYIMNVGNKVKQFKAGDRIVQMIILEENHSFINFDFDKVKKLNDEFPIPTGIKTLENNSKVLFNSIDFDIKPHEIIRFSLGLKAPIPKESVLFIEIDEEELSEGLKDKLWLPNGIGVIDSDYVEADNEGNIFVYIENKASERVIIPKNTPLLKAFCIQFDTLENEIEPTEKRNGGEGSTGGN